MLRFMIDNMKRIWKEKTYVGLPWDTMLQMSQNEMPSLGAANRSGKKEDENNTSWKQELYVGAAEILYTCTLRCVFLHHTSLLLLFFNFFNVQKYYDVG